MAQDGIRDLSLMRELSPDEQKLLLAIWEAAFASFVDAEELGWQTWDFVWRGLAQGNQDGPDPDDILAGLPTVARPGTPGQRYGLVWSSEQSGGPNARIVGLSIAGLIRLAETRQTVLPFANGLAQLMASIAYAEMQLQPVRGGVAQDRVQLSDLTSLEAYTTASFQTRTVMTRLAIGQVLQREYMPISITPSEDGGAVILGWIRSRSFASVDGAESYMAKIADETQYQRDASSLVPSAFELAQTLDYLSLVLERHPAWDIDTHLVDPPDLQSVLCLGQRAESVEDFERFLVVVWNLIGRLRVPDVPVELLDPDRRAPGTLDRLEYWLETNVEKPLPIGVAAALRLIRDVGKLREGVAHNAAGTRAAAVAAASHLGIPTPIVSGEQAWDAVRTRLADAFNTIRDAIRLPGNA